MIINQNDWHNFEENELRWSLNGEEVESYKKIGAALKAGKAESLGVMTNGEFEEHIKKHDYSYRFDFGVSRVDSEKSPHYNKFLIAFEFNAEPKDLFTEDQCIAEYGVEGYKALLKGFCKKIGLENIDDYEYCLDLTEYCGSHCKHYYKGFDTIQEAVATFPEFLNDAFAYLEKKAELHNMLDEHIEEKED